MGCGVEAPGISRHRAQDRGAPRTTRGLGRRGPAGGKDRIGPGRFGSGRFARSAKQGSA
jgi:hypothetical protein